MKKQQQQQQPVDIRRLLTSREAAERLGRSDRWMQSQRQHRRGPPWIRSNGWRALYDPDALDAWLQDSLRPRGPMEPPK